MTFDYHLSKDDLRRLREELAAARVVHTVNVESSRVMERLIRMASERRN